MIFEEIIRPSVQRAGYGCRRSEAKRGNIVKDLLSDLDRSWVVIADLTDQNPNVFYELGVRHSLQDRTILIAQDRGDIPFDLQSYANHVYDWKTDDGRSRFDKKIKELLSDVDLDPKRADNPVSDFLGIGGRDREVDVSIPEQVLKLGRRTDDLEATLRVVLGNSGGSPQEIARSFIAPSDSAINASQADLTDWYKFGLDVAGSEDRSQLSDKVEAMLPELVVEVGEIVDSLNISSGAPFSKNQVRDEAKSRLDRYSPAVAGIEALLLGCAASGWTGSSVLILRVAGELISCGKWKSGLKLAVGLPSYSALRLLCVCGARALKSKNTALAEAILSEPIPVREIGRSEYSYRSFLQHVELFHSNLLLGSAADSVRLLETDLANGPHSHLGFDGGDDCRIWTARFLIIYAMRQVNEVGRPLYPAYRLTSKFSEAAEGIRRELMTNREYRDQLSRLVGAIPDDLVRSWKTIAGKANAQDLGHEYFHNDRRIPEDIEG